jgi:hypothetical protein
VVPEAVGSSPIDRPINVHMDIYVVTSKASLDKWQTKGNKAILAKKPVLSKTGFLYGLSSQERLISITILPLTPPFSQVSKANTI